MSTHKTNGKDQIFLPLTIIWINRKTVFEFFGLIIFPLLIIYEGLYSFIYTIENQTISSIIQISSEFVLGIAYILMMIFVSTFILIKTLNKKQIITLNEVFKIFPFAFRKTFLISVLFVFATILLKNILFIFILFIPLLLPSITILSLYQKIPISKLITENRNFLKTKTGKEFLKNSIIISPVLVAVGLIAILIVYVIFSIFRTFELDIIYWIIKSYIVMIGIFILYFHMNYYYTQEPFCLNEELKAEIDAIYAKKNIKDSRLKSSKNERNANRESNRFSQKDETNRFENY